MEKRVISLFLALIMVFSILPVQAFAAAEPEYLEETEIDEQYVSDGAFYFASAGAELYENADHGYLLKVARWGAGDEAASVRLTMTDITASFGEDYTVRLYDAGVFEGNVKNKGASESVLEFMQNNVTEEYNYSDAVIDGLITAENQLSEEEQVTSVFSDEEKAEIESASNEFLSAILGEPAEVLDEASEVPAKASSALAAARAAATGLADDRTPATYGAAAAAPEAEDAAYMTDSVAAVSEALNAAYLIIDFAATETERYVEIRPQDNSRSDGNRQSNFALSGEENAAVSDMYSSFTLKLIDDEPYVPDTIEFSAGEYVPEEGYVTVTVQRSGSLTGVLTVMLDTSDDTAIGDQDYSQVHAKLIFGFGVSERKIKIPICSEFLENEVRFKLTLSQPQDCTIGAQSTAYCVIRPEDISFSGTAMTAAAPVTATLTATEDMNLNSVIVGEKFCLPDMYAGCYLTNSDCLSQAYGQDGWMLYAHKHGDDVEAAAAFNLDGPHYDYSGYEVYWSRKADKPHWGSTKFWSFTGGISFDTLYNKDTERWSNHTDQYFLHTDASTLFEFHLYAETGWFAKNATLEIYHVKPIMRPFRIQLMGAEPFELIDNNGNRVKNTETTVYASENEVMLLNSDSSDSLVTTTGSSVTVELRNNTSPIAYISGLYLVNADTNEKVLIKSYPVGTTSASLEITNDLIRRNLKYVQFKDNGSHGRYGTFSIQPVVSNMPATVRVQKHDNAEITVWDESVITPAYSDAKENVYECSVGDVLRYNVKLAESDSEEYEWDRMTIETIRPAGQQKYDIYRKAERDYAQEDVGGTEIRVTPIVTSIKNNLIVRVKQSEKDLFDTTYGIFAYPSASNGAYLDYTVDTRKVAGKNYELSAKAKDGTFVPVWYVANRSGVKYSQDTFYFTAAAQQDDNIVCLSLAKADDTPYSIAGTVYYDDAALGGAVSAEAWYPASGAYYIVDSAHYGIADVDGNVRTAPVHGIAGDYVRFKITAAGYTDYSDIQLRQENIRTEEYPSSDGDPYTVSFYELDTANRVISATNMQRPHIKSITARATFSTVTSTSVKINNKPVTFTITAETTDPATGLPYTYTYTDENGVEQTRTETPVAVDLIICDPVTHEQKYVITGAKNSGGTGRSWQLTYTFTHDEYTKYMAGDLIYARLTTDRFIGDGCSENEAGERIPVDALRETVYAPVRSRFVLSGINPQEPQVIDIKIDPNHGAQGGTHYSLPFIGDLTTMINASGLSFGISGTETGGVRVYFGVSWPTGNHFDGNGNPVSDNGFVIDSSNIKTCYSEMSSMISSLGEKNKLGAMSLGIPVWSIEPMAGIYLEFAIYNDAASDVGEHLEYVGGGGYIGVVGSFRYTYYMVVYGIPVYVGGDVSMTLLGELGIAVDEDTHIPFSEPSQEMIDRIIDESHFQFLFRAVISANAYAGFGICGTLGLRGGFSLYIRFIANPMIRKTYPTVRPSGFAVSGSIKFWGDVVLFTIPAPLFTWDLLKMGYFEDIDEIRGDNPPVVGAAGSGTLGPIASKARNAEKSEFVGDKPILRSTFDNISSRNIVENSYDDAQQKLIPLGDGRILMVYLDDDKTRDADERTALMYTLYDSGTWSEPVILQNDGTADFAPYVCDAGEDVVITWVSRPTNTVLNDYRDYLSSTEVYVIRMKKSDLSFGSIEQLTDDDYYDTNPIAVYDSDSKDVLVMYAKSEVGVINDSDDLMEAALPYSNGSILMYMLYDGATGKWVRDRFFENELADGADADALLAEFQGQRFAPTAAFGQTNPIISDLTADTAVITNLNAEDLDDFDSRYLAEHGITPVERSDGGERIVGKVYQDYLTSLEKFKQEWTKPYGIYAYTVDEDNDLSTDADREVFVQLYDFAEHKMWPAIQITCNEENDSLPQIIHVGDQGYLFWLHDGKEIRYINAADMMNETDEHGFVRHRTVSTKPQSGELDDLSISSFRAFADNNQNLFVAWQQNSAPLSEEENPEFAPTQDIYLAGYVQSSGVTGDYSNWSDAIRMTDNGKLNDLPEFADLGGGRLMMVNTQYDLDLSGDVYTTANVNLVETDYGTISSLEVADVQARTVPQIAGDTFEVDIKIKNTGVKSESGFDYDVALLTGGKAEQEKTGRSVSQSVPAGGTITITETFTLPESAVGNLDALNIKMYIKENGAAKPVLSGQQLFDGKPYFEFTELETVQEGDYFRISGLARNIGTGCSDGTEHVAVAENGKDGAVLASAVIPAAEVNTAVPFTARVKIDPNGAQYGYINYALAVCSPDERPLSDWELVRGTVVNPFNLRLNESDSDEITISKGQSLSLRTTYEPATFYRNANAKYAVEDAMVATINGNSLVGLEEGETVLRMTIDPYGGSKTVIVKVGPETVYEDPEITVPVSGEENSVNVKATVSGKTATVQPIKEEILEKVIGDNVETGMVTIDMSGLKQDVTGVKLPTETVKAIAEAAAEAGNDTAGLSIEFTSGKLEFDAKALKTISDAAGNAGYVEIHFDDVGTTRLNADQKKAVSEMTVVKGYEAYVIVNGKRISDFNGGTVTVYIPYEVPADHKPEGYTVWFVAEDGTLVKMNSTYDGTNHRFVVTHFSDYVLTYDETVGTYDNCPKDATCPIEKFTDTKNDFWWHDGIHYCLENGLMAGLSDTVFAPKGTTTRAQIVAILWRLEGKPYVNYAMSFQDVAAGQWYTEAVRWAAAEKIVSGYDAEHFGPGNPITREQLATILYNYAKYKGQGFTGDWMFLLDFVDRADISSWADEAVHWCSMKGVVSGKGGKVFDPQGNATRAEAASMMQRFCETLGK